MFFKRKPLIGNDLSAWIHDNFDWVAHHRPTWWDRAELYQATRAYFTAPANQGHQTAVAVAEDVRRLLGLERTFRIEALPDLPDHLSHEYGVLSRTAGQYWHDEEDPVVTYDPKMLRFPTVFINLMAHELMHARLAPVVEALPGGDGAHELATDLHCIIAGFGLFQLEAAEQAGWFGYMSQPARAVALAEFIRRKAIPPEDALSVLSSRPRKWLKRALRDT